MGNLAQSYIADAIRAVALATAEEARVPLFLARVPLSEERWQEIKEASRLPDEARGDIERALALGKHLWASAKRV